MNDGTLSMCGGTTLKKDTQLILALDVVEHDRAVEIVKDVVGSVDGVKVGYPLVLSCGLRVVNELSRFSPVIADFKVADIPSVNQLICDQVFGAGAEAVIAHGFAGEDSLGACVGVAETYGGGVFVVAEMSHPGGLRFYRSSAEEIARIARESGACGIVAPATRPERIRELKAASGGLTVISPGVGVQGGNPAKAIRAGADYIIVGRSIYQSKTPGTTAMKIVDEIKYICANDEKRFSEDCE